VTGKQGFGLRFPKLEEYQDGERFVSMFVAVLREWLDTQDVRAHLGREQEVIRGLPAGDNPFHPEYSKPDRVERMMQVAPVNALNAVMGNETVPACQRLRVMANVQRVIDGQHPI
jgi:hypothetical protein